ncbi:ribosome biogenesis protein SLX9-domain-containing protein [Pavlovales sp. CCMP2436]|nr:ribosome biogenesis protein SLX9-domain-containing protein [Pavlovales sp. CCMP2436]|mmetsp:Transcript_2266/g.5595  ORF Transcript_2266/g.5595 Transcript_2266/m.5595 type:complete len:168 (-) Transcript_2266:88-591(-)
MVKKGATNDRREKLLQKVEASADIKKGSKTKGAKEVGGALGSVARLADSLNDALEEEGGSRKGRAGSKKTSLGLKARTRLISAETERFTAVLQHAEFKASPFETIEKHLANTLAAKAMARAAEKPVDEKPAKMETGRRPGLAKPKPKMPEAGRLGLAKPKPKGPARR